MGRLFDEEELQKYIMHDGCDKGCGYIDERDLKYIQTVEAIPKANVYKAIQEVMKYEHEGFINISLGRLDEILKKCGVSEDVDNRNN